MDYQNEKVNLSFLNKTFKNFGINYAPIVSKYFDSRTLTLMTLIWSFLIIFIGFLARNNSLFIWGIIIIIILQQLTDTLDGAVGRYKKEGYIKWGWFMDHLLDIIFAFSIFISLMIYFYKKNNYIVFSFFIIMICTVINMISSLMLACEDKGIDMSICFLNLCFSTDESRVGLILLLILIMYNYKKIYTILIFIILIFSIFLTIINIYNKQNKELNKDNINKLYKNERT